MTDKERLAEAEYQDKCYRRRQKALGDLLADFGVDKSTSKRLRAALGPSYDDKFGELAKRSNK